MTMARTHNSPDLRCRRLGAADLPAIASIHREAFSSGTLTAFGPKCVEKYYAWHMEGKHAVATLGLESEHGLIGFCVLLSHNQFFGFLHRALPDIVASLLRSPSLAIRRGFASRVRGGMGLLIGRGGASQQPATIRILAIAVRPCCQGQGFAQILLKAAAELAQSRGASALALSVHPDNERAVRAYVRDGWERVLTDGQWRGLMRKSLVNKVGNPPTVSVI